MVQVGSAPCSAPSISTGLEWRLLSSHPWSKFAHRRVPHLRSPQLVSGGFFRHIHGPGWLSAVFRTFDLHRFGVAASFVTSMVQVCSPPCSAPSISTECEWRLLSSHPWSRLAQRRVPHLRSPQVWSGGFFRHIHGPSLLTAVFRTFDLHRM